MKLWQLLKLWQLSKLKWWQDSAHTVPSSFLLRTTAYLYKPGPYDSNVSTRALSGLGNDRYILQRILIAVCKVCSCSQGRCPA